MSMKGRNFNGCWTCRNRKVKCDLRKPLCLRCERANLQCEGYSVRLSWAPPLAVSEADSALISLEIFDSHKETDSFQRRSIEFTKFGKESTYLTFAELTGKLDKLENAISKQKLYDYKVGPFSVYKLNNANTKAKRKSEKEDHQASAKKRLNDGSSRDVHERLKLSKIESSFVHEDLIEYAKLNIFALKGLEYELDEQNMLHILYPKFFPNIDSAPWYASGEKTSLLFNYDSGQLIYTPLCKKLINNIPSIDLTFVKISYKNNLWNTTVLPVINSIIGEIICSNTNLRFETTERNDEVVDIEELKREIKACILFLVLSLSAFFQHSGMKSEKTSGKDDLSLTQPGRQQGTKSDKSLNDYEKEECFAISIELRKKVITLLNYHLDEYDNHMIDDSFEYDNMLLLCIILQLQIDSYFSVFENFELLHAIGEFILKERFNKHEVLSNLSKYLIFTFKIMHIFFESSHSINFFNYSIEEEDEENYRDLKDNYDLTTENDNDDNRNKSYDISIFPKAPVIGQESDLADAHSESIRNAANSGSEAISSAISGVPLVFSVQFSENNAKTSGTRSTEVLNSASGNVIIDQKYSSSNGGEKRNDYEGPVSSASRDASKHTADGHRIENIPTNSRSYIPNIGFQPLAYEEVVHQMCGIPSTLLNLFFRVIHLTNHKKLFSQRGVFPRNFPKICAEIEDLVLNWKLEDSWCLYSENAVGQQGISDASSNMVTSKAAIEQPTSYFKAIFNNMASLSSPSSTRLQDTRHKSDKKFLSTFHECLYHLVMVFHNSIIVYFCQLIKEDPIHKYKHYIWQALYHLDVLSTLKGGLKRSGINISLSFWPVLVCGCDLESEEEQKALIQFWEKENFGVSNWWRAKQILYEIWQRRREGDSCSWMDMVREWDIVLSL
ncbi:Piso0_005712 [Millerozyma farinosa CBS 7064]|uniref:Piso0_005712 protein n=1 Tax=Pichia sorbitophila (strain ATCC MYA-4447 / BCRC 22081 / CBS 7064 / NBRC 10061 / NRRL Y-12695) TaxID=559304 RepID=G8Y2Q2_PICSO|nr:Piso0_005712 [Millerozyma farinosa CBS 7064]